MNLLPFWNIFYLDINLPPPYIIIIIIIIIIIFMSYLITDMYRTDSVPGNLVTIDLLLLGRGVLSYEKDGVLVGNFRKHP